MGEVSQERAAEIAGMGRLDFLLGILRIGVKPFQYSAEELLDEVEDVRLTRPRRVYRP
jgi:predicted HTH domain antitoxin